MKKLFSILAVTCLLALCAPAQIKISRLPRTNVIAQLQDLVILDRFLIGTQYTTVATPLTNVMLVASNNIWPAISAATNAQSAQIINEASNHVAVAAGSTNVTVTTNAVGNKMVYTVNTSGGGSVSDPLRLGNGTGSAPTYSFTSDTGLGIYRRGSGILGLAAGGQAWASVSSSGLLVLDSGGVERIRCGSAGELLVKDGAGNILIALSSDGSITCSGAIHSVVDPTYDQDAATKIYVDSAATRLTNAVARASAGTAIGLTVKQAASTTTNAVEIQDSSGNIIGRVITNGIYLGRYDFVATLQTTDNTTNTIYSFAPVDNATTRVVVDAMGYNSTSSSGYGRIANFKSVSGTVSQISITASVGLAEDDSAYDCLVDTSSNTIRVRVAGNTGKTVNWTVYGRVYYSQ